MSRFSFPHDAIGRVGWLFRSLILVAAVMFSFWLLDKNLVFGGKLNIFVTQPFEPQAFYRPLVSYRTLLIREKLGPPPGPEAFRFALHPPRSFRRAQLSFTLANEPLPSFGLISVGAPGTENKSTLFWHERLAQLQWPRIEEGGLTLFQRPLAAGEQRELFDSIAAFQRVVPVPSGVASTYLSPTIGRSLRDEDWPDLAGINYLVAPTPQDNRIPPSGTVVSETFDLTELFSRGGEFEFVIPAPGIQIDQKTFALKEIRVVFEGDALTPAKILQIIKRKLLHA